MKSNKTLKDLEEANISIDRYKKELQKALNDLATTRATHNKLQADVDNLLVNKEATEKELERAQSASSRLERALKVAVEDKEECTAALSRKVC